jgi:hypothetical protein
VGWVQNLGNNTLEEVQELLGCKLVEETSGRAGYAAFFIHDIRLSAYNKRV